jgi:O-antigen ligase
VRVRYSSVALLVLVDQLLLPMFHIGGFPFKVSYLVLGLALLPRMQESNAAGWDRARVTRDWQVALAIGAIVVAGILGELWLSATHSGVAHDEAVRSSATYVLAVLAFFLGQRATGFRFEWLVRIFLVAVTLNFCFIIFRNSLPDWLTGFYFPEQAGEMSVFEYIRPRGLFGNPNVSAHMVTIPLLFVHVALRHRLLIVSSTTVGVAIVALPVLLSGALATRGELIVSLVLGFLNYRLLFGKRSLRPGRVRRMLLAGGIAALLFTSAAQIARSSDWASQFVRVSAMVFDAETRTSRQGGIARPLIALEDARARFVASPVFGTGFGAAEVYPFDDGTIYYHNDWFRLFVTSGVIGFLAMVWLLWRFAWPLGWPVLIPLFLPGMVNTFMLNVPAFICYFLMLGVLGSALVRRVVEVPVWAGDGGADAPTLVRSPT